MVGWEEVKEEKEATYYRFKCATWGGEQWTVLKRFSEVLALHKTMKSGLGHESLKNFPFPAKSLFNSGDKLKDRRKTSFELYFRFVHTPIHTHTHAHTHTHTHTHTTPGWCWRWTPSR